MKNRSRQRVISAHTELLGVFGYPVRHSLSPLIHNAALAAQGLDYVYLAFEVPPDLLPQAIGGMRALGMRGANITVPHKQAVVALLDRVDPIALRVGAVNTVVNSDGCLVGYNTDVEGFRRALLTVCPQGVKDESCLVVGAGGAARAVLAALVEERVGRVYIANRTKERAVALSDAAKTWGGETDVVALTLESVREVMPQVRVVVNATPLGLASTVKELPFPVDTMHSGHVVLDLAYDIEDTQLVRAAKERGAVAADGKEMLIQQAAGSYKLWTGFDPPLDTMRDCIMNKRG
ncbi:MAG: shikimate dehydrogenase [Thermoleophilia bacterium]|nr:shikimate dehydrogenase [Thermoleophilia bacterium]